jgi:hypothetical protein
MRRPYPGLPTTSSDFSIADSPFQIICVPMQTSKNDESRMITLTQDLRQPVRKRIAEINAPSDQHRSNHRPEH